MHSTNSTLNTIALGLSVLLGGCSVDTMPPANLPAARADLPAPEALPAGARGDRRVLDGRVWTGARSGFVALVARDGRLIHASTRPPRRRSRLPMTMDTRFQMASMTKPVTAVAAMMLVEEGKLGLDDPVSRLPAAICTCRSRLRDSGEGTGTEPPPDNAHPFGICSPSLRASGAGFDKTRWLSVAEKGSTTERARSRSELNDWPPYPCFFEQPGTEWRYGDSLDVDRTNRRDRLAPTPRTIPRSGGSSGASACTRRTTARTRRRMRRSPRCTP